MHCHRNSIVGLADANGVTGVLGTYWTTQVASAGVATAYGAYDRSSGGERVTWGSVTGDAATALILPSEFTALPGGQIVNGGVHGMLTGTFSSFAQQSIDSESVNWTEVGQKSLDDGATEVITGTVAPNTYFRSSNAPLVPATGSGQ